MYIKLIVKKHQCSVLHHFGKLAYCLEPYTKEKPKGMMGSERNQTNNQTRGIKGKRSGVSNGYTWG